MIKQITVIFMMTTLAGCAIFNEEVTPRVAKAVRLYCGEPFDVRQVVRKEVNRELAQDGHSVAVTCAGDP